jgi:hypothetical protein
MPVCTPVLCKSLADGLFQVRVHVGDARHGRARRADLVKRSQSSTYWLQSAIWCS